jgi:Tfp pilus assembly protein PilV
MLVVVLISVGLLGVAAVAVRRLAAQGTARLRDVDGESVL